MTQGACSCGLKTFLAANVLRSTLARLGDNRVLPSVLSVAANLPDPGLEASKRAPVVWFSSRAWTRASVARVGCSSSSRGRLADPRDWAGVGAGVTAGAEGGAMCAAARGVVALAGAGAAVTVGALGTDFSASSSAVSARFCLSSFSARFLSRLISRLSSIARSSASSISLVLVVSDSRAPVLSALFYSEPYT